MSIRGRLGFLEKRMKTNNKIMLITYGDSLGKNLKELNEAMDRYFGEAVGGIHILPFFPSSADRGFAPTRYDIVDPALGTFDDIERLESKFYLMYDFMVNHISRQSEYFKDFLKNKDKSPYKDFFINFDEIWGSPPTQEQIDKIYKRKPRAPYLKVEFADGSTEKMWCTFGDEQIDFDVTKKSTREFIEKTVNDMCDRGAAIIRLDAFAYALKKKHTNCFFVEPDIWELLNWINDVAAKRAVMILPEIHEHYSIQMKLVEKGYWIYDFALPMLLLHALYTGKAGKLKSWLDMCPPKQFTTLDTHDGIGVVDVADILDDDEIELTRELLYSKGANIKRKYSSAEYNNLDIYQINCTYYSALGNNDNAYLTARAIQFFAPGIPQVYYVGMLAGKNDIELLEKTKQGRDINRHGYTLEEIESEVQRPVVKMLLSLMEFRNRCPAFEGDFKSSVSENGSIIKITRTKDKYTAILTVDLKYHTFDIVCEAMNYRFNL